MMMGSSIVASSTISEALSLINAVLDPQTAKAGLEELRAETAKHEQARVAAIEEQKKAASDRAAADTAMAALANREAELAEREHAVAARAAQFEKTRAELRSRFVASGEAV
jgi:hypothetical protein